MDTVVARYAGEPGKVSQYSRPLADAPGLKGKLSELASQLAAVQSEACVMRLYGCHNCLWHTATLLRVFWNVLELSLSWRFQNEAIRGRYLELEYAWQGMIQENKRVHSVNEELRDELSVTPIYPIELSQPVVVFTLTCCFSWSCFQCSCLSIYAATDVSKAVGREVWYYQCSRSQCFQTWGYYQSLFPGKAAIISLCCCSSYRGMCCDCSETIPSFI